MNRSVGAGKQSSPALVSLAVAIAAVGAAVATLASISSQEVRAEGGKPPRINAPIPSAVAKPQSGHTAGGSCAKPLACGDKNCCALAQVDGGNFPIGLAQNDPDFNGEGPEHPGFVSPFFVDVFEVTVGRFRQFVDAYTGTPPGVGEGSARGGGGWEEGWNEKLPDAGTWPERLACDRGSTFTPLADKNEALPVTCVDWFAAAAFCIWDGGRLPTEAEWEFLSKSGSEGRPYPWGASPPSSTLAKYGAEPGDTTPSQVGAAVGADAWGVRDLAGNAMEWTIDCYGAYGDLPWSDKVNVNCLPVAGERVVRGGSILSPARELRSTWRSSFSPSTRRADVGFRCVR